MAITAQDGQRIAEAAKASGRQPGICFQNRYNGASKRIRELIDSGGLGAVRGGITMLLSAQFGIEPTNMLLEPGYFAPIYIGTDIWQSIGWNSIVYLSALTAIDQELCEAARVDGANQWNQKIHITIPCLIPTIVIMFIL